MPAPFFFLRRQGPQLLRASTAALVLAGALSTLARVSEPAPEPDAAPVAKARAEAETAAPTAAQPTTAGAPAQRWAAARSAMDRGTWAAPSSGPPPFAPGGDDLLPSSDDLSHRSRASTADGPSTVPMHAAAPRLWLERSTVGLGQTAVLHLAAADGASSCRGAGALEGVAIAGHRIGWRVTAAGQHRLAVVCTGAGGAAASEVLLTVPLPAAVSSLDSQHALGAGQASLPGLDRLGLRAIGAAGAREKDLMVAGDFLQQGRLSLFVVAAGADGAAAAHLMAGDGAGPWRDRSAELLDDTQRGVCASAAQAIGSDFNRDGRPDVWIACDGRQLLFLSQPDGRYRRIETPFELRARQAEARDVDGDGWPDIVTLDSSPGAARTLLLLGRGDGRFEAGPAEAWRLSLPLPLSGSSR